MPAGCGRQSQPFTPKDDPDRFKGEAQCCGGSANKPDIPSLLGDLTAQYPIL
jgi:hypothetical protein